MKRSTRYLLIGAFFLLHNLEELLTMPVFLPKWQALLAHFFLRPPTLISAEQFSHAIYIIIILTWLALVMLSRWKNQRKADLFACAIQVAIGLNAILHVGQSLIVRAYVPGLLTAIFINLPWTIRLYREWKNTWQPTQKMQIQLLLTALLLHGPVLWAVLQMAKR